MGRTTSIADQVRVNANRDLPTRTVRELDESMLVPTGSTLLNLACSDNPYGGYGLGKIVTLPGSSSGGKTLLTLTTFAEAARCKRLDGYHFIFDDVEASLEFDTEYLFGSRMASRMSVPPNGSSNTIQNFKANILQLNKDKKSYIYCLDSFDSLTSDEEVDKEMRKALAMAKSEEAAKQIAGSYGAEKAKIAGQTLRMITSELKKTNSLLIIIQQLRQNMGGGPFSPKYVTSGGEAPFFYSTHQVWLTRLEKIKEKERKVGSRVKAEVRKNKLTGKERSVEFDVYYDYGVDDIGSCIDFLLYEEFWLKKTGGFIIASDLDLCERRTDLIRKIEADGLQPKLIEATAAAWRKIEKSIESKRSPKYE